MAPDEPAQRQRSTTYTLLVYASSSWVRLLLTLSTGLVLTPLLIKHMGVDLFGLFTMIAVTVAAADPIQTTLKRALTRELTLAVSSGEPGRLRRTFSNAVILAAAGSLITIVIPAIIALLAPHILTLNSIPVWKAQLAIVCEGFLIASMAVLSPWLNLYLATKRIVNDNISQTLSRLLDLVAALAAFRISDADPFVAFILLRAGFRGWQMYARSLIIRFQVPDARFSPSLFDKPLFREMATTGGWSSGNQIASFAMYASDHYILNIFRGPVFNGLYGVIIQLLGYTRMLGANLTYGADVIAADLQHQGRHATVRKMLLRLTAHTFTVNGVCAAGMIAFAGPIMQVWLGKQLESDDKLLGVMTYHEAIRFAWLYIAVMLPGFVLSETHLASSVILYGMGRVREYAPPLIVGSILRVITAVGLMAAGFAPIALAWCSLAFFIAIFGLFFPWLIARTAEEPLSRLAWRVYLRPALSFIPVVLLGLWAAEALGPWTGLRHAPKLALVCISIGAVYAPFAYILCLEPDERSQVRTIITKVLARLPVLRRFAPTSL